MAKPSNGYVSSVYGNQRYYNGVFAEDYYHRGVDYAAGNGSPTGRGGPPTAPRSPPGRRLPPWRTRLHIGIADTHHVHPVAIDA